MYLPNQTSCPWSSTIIGPCSPAPSFKAMKMYPEEVPCTRIVTSTAAGLRSGRERKAHTPFGGAGGTLGKVQTLGVRKGLTLGACKDLSFVLRPSSWQPAVFVDVR